MCEGLETLGAMKMFDIRSIILGVYKEFYEILLVPTVTYGGKTWGSGMDENRKVDVKEMKYVQIYLDG